LKFLNYENDKEKAKRKNFNDNNDKFLYKQIYIENNHKIVATGKLSISNKNIENKNYGKISLLTTNPCYASEE